MREGREDITFRVQGYFETTIVTTTADATIRDVKLIVASDLQIPVSNIEFYFGRTTVNDDQPLSYIGVEDESTIKMKVTSTFLERVHPFQLRDPMTGLLLKDPLQCGDLYSYQKAAFEEWTENLQRQPMVSPITGCFMKSGKADEALSARVTQYIQAIDAGSVPEENLSLDCLGRVHNFIGHFRDCAGGIPCSRRLRMVCLGKESAQKSTFLNRLTFMPIFPRGWDHTCTPISVEIRCHRGPQRNPMLRVIRGRGRGVEMEEQEDLRERMNCVEQVMVSLLTCESAMAHRVAAIEDRRTQCQGSDALCEDHYIVLDLSSPTLPDLTYVDFLGLASKDTELLTRRLQHEFETFGDSSIYLHMTKASELTEDGLYSYLETFEGGRLLQRTVGVVTGVELVDPNRLEELVDLTRGCKRQARDQLFTNGTFLVVTGDEQSDPLWGLEPLYLRAERERRFRAECGWNDIDVTRSVAGSIALIRLLHRMHFEHLEKTSLPHVITRMQDEWVELKRRDRALGLPAVVFPIFDNARQSLLTTIITGMISTLEKKLPSLLLKFDATCIYPLEMDLGELLSVTRTIPAMDVDENIYQVYEGIMACFMNCKVSHGAFWLKELSHALRTDESDMRLGRFGEVIDAWIERVQWQLDGFYESMEYELNLSLQETNVLHKLSCEICADRSQNFEEPMVQLSFKIHPGTLAHSIGQCTQVIVRTIEDFRSIQELPCSLVENCRQERFATWTEQRLLRVASTELLNLAHEFASTGCVVCPKRMVSLYHPQTCTFLGVVGRDGDGEGTCSTYFCPQFVMDTESEDLEKQVGVRFQVVGAGGDQVAFWCPATEECLSVTGERLGVHAISDPFNCCDLPREVVFRVDFQPPPEAFSEYASKSVSLYNTSSSRYLEIIPTEDDRTCITLTESIPLDREDPSSVFLVVDNPI